MRSHSSRSVLGARPPKARQTNCAIGSRTRRMRRAGFRNVSRIDSIAEASSRQTMTNPQSVNRFVKLTDIIFQLSDPISGYNELVMIARGILRSQNEEILKKTGNFWPLIVEIY